MKIIILGSGGQLGHELSNKGVSRGFEVIPLDLPQFDITDKSHVQGLLKHNGLSLVINASAYTAVDKAESEESLAFAVNCDGPGNLARVCSEAGIPLIHVSTDYVFDGQKNSAYLETDPVSPLGVYGKSKAAGEAEVRNQLQEHIIVRTAWLYGVHGQNFVKTMIRLGKAQEKIRVVDDQIGCPTYAADLADAVLDLSTHILRRRPVSWGTFHYCSQGKTSWYGFAEKVFEMAHRYTTLKIKEVEPIPTHEYPTPAKRPARSVMDCSLLEARFGIRSRLWEEGLGEMIHSLFQTEDENHNL